MLQQLFISVPADGLNGLWNSVLSGWITPIYVAFIAIMALMFLKDRSIRGLLTFVGIAAVVGVLVFGGQDLFGSKDKGITGAANDQAKKIGNSIVLTLDK